MQEERVETRRIAWEDAPGYPPGTRMKVLHRTTIVDRFLLHLPRGFEMDAHSHIYSEEHFVLEGEYQSEGQTWERGAYRRIPAHVSHGPFTSDTGAILLVIRGCLAADDHYDYTI